MTDPAPNPNRSRPVRQPVLLGLFAGTAVGAGYLLAGVPNVELMTLIIALAGRVLGPRLGAVCGAAAAGIYSLGSPYGLPLPLLLAAQMAAQGVTGLLGGVLGPRAAAAPGRPRRALAAAGLGLLATTVYQVLTTAAGLTMADTPLRGTIALAAPYFLIQVGANVLIFATLFAPLADRLARLSRPGLVGRGAVGALALALLAWAPSSSAQDLPPVAHPAAAPADTAAAADTTKTMPGAPHAAPDAVPAPAAADSVPGARDAAPAPNPLGWQRSLWQPFAPTVVEWAAWRSPLVAVVDGGVGAQAMVLGEAGTSPLPAITRDGVPLGTGHVLADDLWLVPLEGVAPAWRGGADDMGGTDGQLALATVTPADGRAASTYHGHKGNHETYYRGVTLDSPRAAWQAGFSFEESLDNEGYNFTDRPDELFATERPGGFTGQGKVRQNHLRLQRTLAPEQAVWLEAGVGRRTKDALPALGADRLEAWDRNAAATWLAGGDGWRLRTTFFWRQHDVEWGDRYTTTAPPPGTRLLETSRGGARLGWHGPVAADGAAGWRVDALFTDWRLRDTGDASAVAPDTIQGAGRAALATLGGRRRAGPITVDGRAGVAWAEAGGAGPLGELALAGGTPGAGWRLELAAGGRAPRSDELLTPLVHDVAGRRLALLPNADLDREKSLRAALMGEIRLWGLDLAVEGGARRLRRGITWRPLPGAADSGAWSNDLSLDALLLRGSVARAGRFLGWGRARVSGTWQRFDEKAGRAAFLPPERYVQVQLLWENHFFQEDGILQLALYSTLRGPLDDPWDVTRTSRLPSRTVHDLLVGFRLVGADLSVAMRNLTGERAPLTAGSLSPGRELQLRLAWLRE